MWNNNNKRLQRWNASKSEKAKYNPSFPFLFPRPYEGLYEPVREVLRSQADNVNCQVWPHSGYYVSCCLIW